MSEPEAPAALAVFERHFAPKRRTIQRHQPKRRVQKSKREPVHKTNRSSSQSCLATLLEDGLDVKALAAAYRDRGRDLLDEARKFEDTAFHTKSFVYRRTADTQQLNKLRDMLIRLQKHLSNNLSPAASHLLSSYIVFGNFAASVPFDYSYELQEFLLLQGITDGTAGEDDELLNQITKNGHSLEESFKDFIQLIPDLVKAIDSSISHIQSSSRTRGGRPPDLEVVQFVEAARIAWTENTRFGMPNKALNEAGPFGKFLADLFEAYGKDRNDYRPAFRAWIKLRSEYAQKFAKFMR